MKTEDTKIPAFALIALIFSAFIPVFPLLLIYLNSAFHALLEMVWGTRSIVFVNIVNLIGATGGLLGYLFARQTPYKIMWTFLYLLFIISVVVLAIGDKFYDKYPYFLPFLITAFIVILPLYLLGAIKEKQKLSKGQ
jgi:hypothetical protein